MTLGLIISTIPDKLNQTSWTMRSLYKHSVPGTNNIIAELVKKDKKKPSKYKKKTNELKDWK